MLRDVREKVDLEVAEDLNVLQNPPVQEGAHLYLQVFVQNRKDLILVHLHRLL